jgi:hypothetical protein
MNFLRRSSIKPRGPERPSSEHTCDAGLVAALDLGLSDSDLQVKESAVRAILAIGKTLDAKLNFGSFRWELDLLEVNSLLARASKALEEGDPQLRAQVLELTGRLNLPRVVD